METKKKLPKFLLLFLLCLVLVGGILPRDTFANVTTTVTIDLSNPGTSTSDYTVSNGKITLTNQNAHYILTGKTNYYGIVAQNGYFYVTLNNVDMSAFNSPSKISPISILGKTSTLNLTLKGNNKVLSQVIGKDAAGISGGSGANIVIVGDGSLEVEGSNGSAGIGATGSDYCGDITIDGVYINATSGHDGAAIGAGYYKAWPVLSGNVGDITIKNSTIVATADNGAGIGAGDSSTCGNILIINSTITAEGGKRFGGSGIGAGSAGDASYKSITIKDSKVTATGSQGYHYGGGIGGGYASGTSGDILIDNSTVDAKSYLGASIGAGYSGSNVGNITIQNNSFITATNKSKGAAIGGGCGSGTSGDINIINSTISAHGYSAGIGGGNASSNSGNIFIKGNSKVEAYGGTGRYDFGAGIGGGTDDTSYSGNIKIEDSASVKAVGGSSSAGIGNSYGINNSGTIEIADTTTINAYGNNNYAISPNKVTSESTAYIINAYYSQGSVDSFKIFNSSFSTNILSSSQDKNINIPPNYTSFAYNTPKGDYTHNYVNNNVSTWLIKINDGSYVVTSTKDMVPTPLKLTSIPFAVKHTVTFDADGGSPIPQQQLVAKGSKLSIPTEPTKNSFAFAGWYTDKTYATMWDFNKLVTSDLNLVAKWIANSTDKFTVKFDSNGGSAVKPITNVPFGTTVKMPSTPKKEGNCFSGWFVDKDFNTRWIFSKDKVYSDMTLYGKWCY